MNRQETDIYISQMIESYRWYGRIYPSLGEVRSLMTREGAMYERIGRIMDELSAGIADIEKYIRHIPSKLGIKDARMIILHTALEGMEKKGMVCEEALDLMRDEFFSMTFETAGYTGINNKKLLKGSNNKKLIKLYESLCSPGNDRRKDKYKRAVRAAVSRSINVWMLGMSVYTLTAGADNALRMSGELVDDVFRTILRRFELRVTGEGAGRDICLSFMSELDIPEAGSCMLRCFKPDEYDSVGKRTPGGTYLHAYDMKTKKRKKAGPITVKGACMVMIIMLVGIMITGMTAAKTDDKEARLRQAMTGAMKTTVEKMDDMKQTNALMAVFMQRMLSLVDDDVDLTVRICEIDKEEHEMEVEAVGEYGPSGNDRRRVAVRRRISF